MQYLAVIKLTIINRNLKKYDVGFPACHDLALLIFQSLRYSSLTFGNELKFFYMSLKLISYLTSFNKAGYTANKQSLAGQYAEGQGQSISGQGLYFRWAGAVMLRNHKNGQFRGIRNFAFRTFRQTLRFLTCKEISLMGYCDSL